MKGPPRLFEEGSSFERSLLRSGLDEGPSADLESRILAAVAAAPAAASISDAGASGARPAVSGFFRPRFFILAAAAVGVGAVLVTSIVERHASVVDRTAAPVVSANPVVAVAPAAPAPAAPEVVLTPDSLPTAPTFSPPSSVPPSVPSSVRSSAATALSASAKPSALNDDGPSLEREIELLDAVKKKLGAGATVDASRALDAYDAEFPHGALRPEATVLRVRTLLLQGNRAAATKLADDFLAKHPSSVHGKRIRALLAE
ncbi:hypothetical protein AKJ09_04894 [Labilithrix luteola]|uniref:Outer membrane lipoprotein BamD-like domain-containing protein n=1 Tax=Labilithrix luteola TaxID=1391654 RepID=A0A0K1PXI0_9BACT|nr:hypothetical protein [Labilithrix luteola]AKU98230.1 hypothetical protein AKJ09_04894 [Labilithrix luteola]